MTRQFLGICLVLVLAGCLAAEQPPDSGAEPTGRPKDPTQAPPGTAFIPQLNQTIAGSECTAIESTFRAPPQWFADEVPPEWRNDDGVRPRYYGFLGFSCERIALPGLERGPAIVLFETHINAEPPEACSAPKEVPSHIIRTIYASNEGLVRGFHDLLGINATLIDASFTRETLAVGETVVHRWTSHHGESQINVTRLDEIGQNFDLDYLFLGVADGGPWRIDFRASVALYQFTSQGTGFVSPETLHVKMYGRDWVGMAATTGNVSFSGDVTRFTDLSCKEAT